MSATLPRAAERRAPAGLLRWRCAWTAPAVGLGLVVLAFVLTWPLFTPNPLDRRWIAPGDFSDQFYPWAHYVGQELRARRLPLWNPFVFGGHPFQADPQTAVFYPVSSGIDVLLGRGGLPYWALELELPVHFSVAAIGAFLLARRVSGSALGGVVAGLAFGFGGFLTSYPAQQLAMLRSAAWLPLVLYGIELALGGGGRPGWLLGAGITYALVVLAGHTQTAMFVAYLVAAYGLWRATERGLGWRWAVVAAVAPLAVGLGLAAVQLWPTLELVAISTRAQLAYDAAAYGYDPRALFGILLPVWRGEKALYVGVAPLALAALALRRPRSPQLFWAIVALFGLLVSVGGHTFLYRALWLVAPGWSAFRDQERTALIWSLAVAVLAAHGVAVLQAAGGDALRWWRRWLAASAVGAFALAAEVLVLWTLRRTSAPINPLDSLLDAAVLLVVFAGLSALLFNAWSRLPRSLGTTLVVTLVVFDLFSVNGANNLSNVDPQSVLRREAALARPREEPEPYRIRDDDDKVIPPNYGMVWRAPMMAGDSPIQLRRTHDLLESREEWRLWQLFNVKYLLSRAERADPGLEKVDRIDDVDAEGKPAPLNVYKVKFSLPRAWAVSDVRVVPEAEAAYRAVFDPNQHPGDVALVEQSPPLPIQPGLPRPDVRVTSLWPNGIQLAVSSTGNALVVVADAWHPGWVATLDGQPAPILRTNYAFRGVAVPAGEHVVEMRFRPRSLLYGAVVSAATALVLLVLLAVALLRKRGDAPGEAPARSI